jgi:hypothetical protein
MTRQTLIVCAALLVMAQSVDAQRELPAATIAPDDTRPELKDLLPQSSLVGKGRLTFFGLQVYDARLWGVPGFKADNFSAQPFALELSYLRDFSNKDVAERSITEMRRASTISDAKASEWIAEMMRAYPDLKKGDRVMGVHKPGLGAAFFVNGKATGEIRDAEFARLFFGIWLSPKTSEPKLRSALLVGAM